jgi:hypothetical protein
MEGRHRAAGRSREFSRLTEGVPASSTTSTARLSPVPSVWAN